MGKKNQKPGMKPKGMTRRGLMRVGLLLLLSVSLWTAAIVLVFILVALFGWRWPHCTILSFSLFGIGVAILPPVYKAYQNRQKRPSTTPSQTSSARTAAAAAGNR